MSFEPNGVSRADYDRLERELREARDIIAHRDAGIYDLHTKYLDALARAEAAEKDAARYRWMRNNPDWDSPIVKLGYDEYTVAQGNELDAAIDEAMK